MTTTGSPPAGVERLQSSPTRGIRTALLSSATLTIMAAAVIAPSLPEMRRVFAGEPGSDVLVRLTLTVTSLAIAVSAPAAGVLADRVGRKPVLLWSLALYAAAGTAGLYTPDLVTLILTRAGLGLAVGGIMTSISALITDLFTGPARARFLGLQAAFGGFGGVVFVPLAGVLASVGWRAPFWLYAFALAVLPLAAVALSDHRPRTAAPTPAAAPAATVVPAGYRRTVAGVYAAALVATVVFFMAPTQLPFLLEDRSLPPTVIGLVVAASTASSAVASLLYARLRRHLDYPAVLALSILLLGVGWTVVGLTPVLLLIVAGTLIGGIGVGFAVPNVTTWLGELAPPMRRGRILGGVVAAIFLGQFLSPLAVAPVVDAAGIRPAFVLAGTATAGAALVIAAVATRASALLHHPGRKPRPGPHILKGDQP